MEEQQNQLEQNQLEQNQQKQILTKIKEPLEQNQKNDIPKDATFKQRLDVLNLKIDPKNPTRNTGGFSLPNKQSLVNGINAVPGLGTVANLTEYAVAGFLNSAKKVGNFFKKDYFEIKPNDFGDWNAQKQNMEKQTAILEPLAKDGELLKTIEGKYKLENGTLDKEEFAKSAVNILSNDKNQDLLEEYLKGEGKELSETEITKAIKDVNKAKHILLTGEGVEDFKPTNIKLEDRNKEFIEFLGYKTKGETNLMSSAEITKTMSVLGKDFGFTLGDKGEIKHEKPKTQSENYKKELKSANNINNKLKIKADKLDYSEQNTESEEQKVKEKAEKAANNQNYSRTSTNTPQSGMSAENMAGNAAVLGGAIASAAVIPFVGWIVALAILYSFKDKFKDDSEENKEFEKVAKSNGLKDDELQKLKDEVAELKKRESENKTTPQDDIIKDLGKYLEKTPSGIKVIEDILKEENKEQSLKDFIKREVYDDKPTNKQKKDINNLINSSDANKTVKEVIKNIQESQEGLNKNSIFKECDKNNTQTIHQRQ